MCRIAAILSKNRNSLIKIKEMATAMKNGGPDGEGFLINEQEGYALGHRRLSIIDLSNNANQPMVDDESNLEITFNGEIYNYKELKLELEELGYQFKTNSDTEVIIKGFSHWKENLLDKLRGMFAFVLIDKNAKKLFAARDHAGIKPLYYSKVNDEYVFASEVRGMKAFNNNWREDKNWKIWFLTFGFIPEPYTTLENVNQLQRGSYLYIDLVTHKEQIVQYTKYEYGNHIESYKKATEITRQLLEQSVKRHLVSDVPVGIFLSGGIDSSILAILAQQQVTSPIETISIYFDDEKYSEKEYQEIIIKQTKVKHHLYKISKEEFIESWDDIYNSLDQPSTDAINTYFICKYAKQNGIKVVLSGLGADEIFGGYPSIHRCMKFDKYKRLAILSKFLPKFIYGNYPNKKFEYLHQNIDASEYLLYRGLFTPNDVASILNMPEKNVWQELSKFKFQENIASFSTQDKATYLETAIYMQSQLLKDSDVQSMWQGIELRVPFLDKDLITYINNIDPTIKFNLSSNKPKNLLVDAFINELPSKIWDRPKQGFTFPFENWFKSIDILQNPYIISQSIYKKFLQSNLSYSRVWAVFLVKINNLEINFRDLNLLKYSPKTLFTYLTAFREAGGIQKVNKTILKALPYNDKNAVETWGIFDFDNDSRYCPSYAFTSFQGKKIRYTYSLIKNNKKWNHIIVGHINISTAIRFVKFLNPKLKITTIVHGIDVWDKQKGNKKWLLDNSDSIISVSHFTKNSLIEVNKIDEKKIKVLHNCLDPYFENDLNYNETSKQDYLYRKYGIDKSEKIIVTVSRIKSTEKYKGYDKVIEALRKIKEEQKIKFKYLICGSYDKKEYTRIAEHIKNNNLENEVILTGFIPDSELVDHYKLADSFIMPSKKEGFGIVFIEAAATGAKVIAGNGDGSKEALQNGRFGTLINPDSIEEIKAALLKHLTSKVKYDIDNSNQIKEFYSFSKYKLEINNLLFA